MNLKELAPRTTSPVPIDEFQAHLRLGYGFADDGAETGLLQRYLLAAQAVVEQQTGQALVARRYLAQVDRWGRRGDFVLPVGPVAAIDALRFRRGAEIAEQSVAALELSPGVSGQVLRGPGGAPLPGLPQGWIAELEFTAGHGADWDSVPRDLAQAVLLLAAEYYGGRSEAMMPVGVSALLQAHRPVRL